MIILINRLEATKKRYDEISEELSNPEVISDIKKMTELSKEQRRLSTTVEMYEKYKNILSDIETAKEMLNDKDMQEFAKEEIRTMAKKNSIGYEKVRYNQKKKKSIKKVKIGVLIIALVAAVKLGATLDNFMVNKDNIVISRTDEANEEIDKKINYYISKLGTGGESSERIITNYLHDTLNGGTYYDYYPGNFINNIVDASKISETEVRCVLIAAYNVIHEGDRNQMFENAFNSIANNSETMDAIPDNLSFLKGGNSQEFLTQLGYDDWHDYQMNERNNIKDLQSIENYIDNGMRR